MKKLSLIPSYREFLIDVKNRYQTAQIKAVHAVSRELIQFYWQLGREITEKHTEAKWGSKFLDQLSKDLQSSFPGSQGFSVRNLKFMRQFAEMYPASIGKQAVSQLPWGHIIVLMQQVKDATARTWYAQNVLENGISRNMLIMQIETDLYKRQGQKAHKISNFKDRLPSPQSDLAIQVLKNPYNFDFLTIGQEAKEREIEKGLIQNISKFLLELGTGFAFLGSQYKLTVDDADYFLDMLFYHVKLHCYIVIELKAGPFKPEHTGKLNFYLSAVDGALKAPTDQPTIGLLLCKSRNKIMAEYSLKNVSSPIGISEYDFVKKLPKKLTLDLPSIEELESELSKKE